MEDGIKVIVRCPACQRRLMNKVTATNVTAFSFLARSAMMELFFL